MHRDAQTERTPAWQRQALNLPSSLVQSNEMVGPSQVLLKRGMAVSDHARWGERAKLKPFGNMMMDRSEIHVLQPRKLNRCSTGQH